MSEYKKNSITLIGAVGLGTGVMISAGIFALLGQITELSGKWFPIIFFVGSIVTMISAYSYMKFSEHFPSAGGLGKYLVEAYGKGVIASSAALMMILSMVINQSLVARTFGTYSMQLFGGVNNDWIIPLLGVGLLLIALIINLSSNLFIQTFTSIVSLIKIIGLLVFAAGALYLSSFVVSLPETSAQAENPTMMAIIASVALSILAFKGFTTITNNGSEIEDPKRNVKRAIILSIIISLIVYLLVSFAVSSNLSVQEIIIAKDYALAEATRPLLGGIGLYFTVILAIVATVSAIIASIFAVSRLIAMLVNMKMVPNVPWKTSFKMHHQTAIFTVLIAIILTIFFDLSRIASMGAILYLTMDIIIHYGLVVKMKDTIKSSKHIIYLAMILDVIVLTAFIIMKLQTDVFIVVISVVIMILIIGLEYLFFKNQNKDASA
jgi:amino acid transporter